MKGFSKIKASALQFAILVSLIIAILLASFLALTHTHRLFGLQSQFLLSSIDAAQKGVEYSLDPKNNIKDSISYEDNQLSTSIKKSAWGGFLKIESTAKKKTKSFSKIALVGQKTRTPRTAVLLSETQLPLILVGNSEIQGNAYISNRGINAGVISGKYFSGKQLIDGEVQVTDGKLPLLDQTWKKQTENLLFDFTENDRELIGLQNKNSNSFYEPTQLIFEEGALVLDQSLVGNIVVKSNMEIIVTQYAKLTDVVLVAPKITVQKGFKGNVHLLASKSIMLEEETKFLYPSSLVVLDENKDFDTYLPEEEAPIYISEGVSFNGVVIYDTKEVSGLHSQTSLVIGTNAQIKGNIYCQGNIALSAAISGCVYARRFIVNESGSRYVNHIYNGKILSKQLPKGFCGLPFSEKKKGVVRWLY